MSEKLTFITICEIAIYPYKRFRGHLTSEYDVNLCAENESEVKKNIHVLHFFKTVRTMFFTQKIKKKQLAVSLNDSFFYLYHIYIRVHSKYDIFIKSIVNIQSYKSYRNDLLYN